MEGKEEVWMSHGDHVATIPKDFEVYGVSENAPFAIIGNDKKHFYGVQFHPESVASTFGHELLLNFKGTTLEHMEKHNLWEVASN